MIVLHSIKAGNLVYLSFSFSAQARNHSRQLGVHVNDSSHGLGSAYLCYASINCQPAFHAFPYGSRRIPSCPDSIYEDLDHLEDVESILDDAGQEHMHTWTAAKLNSHEGR